MNYTTNYRIQKPLNTEKYDVNIYNTNADIIDSALNRLELENASQDALLATKEELSNSNRSIENEIQRATAKENEILDSLNTNKTIWDNKYTREEIDDKFDNIVIPTKISDLENDSNLGSITGIKGDNEAEYRNTGNINITADNIGAAKVIRLYGTSGNVINLDTLTDFGLYKINNNDTIMWVTYNGGNSQIDCRYMELFVGGNDKFKYQIIFPLDYYNKFRMRSITINEDETTEFSEWSEIATLNDLISYIDAQYVKNSQILNTKEQINANTSSKSIAGALAVKEIKNELTNDINQINSNLTEIKEPADIRYAVDNIATPNCLNFVTATTEEIKQKLQYEAFAFKIFAFVDVTKYTAGISIPIILPTRQMGCIQIYSNFDGLDNVYARKFLDGVYYGEW